MYTKAQERRLQDEAPPEIARVPLENVFLQAKALGLSGGDARAFLGRALQPPTAVAIDAAAGGLRRVGAIDGAAEGLTALGHHLARMPLEPRVGKILVYGALLGCIDPALTIAAAMSLARSPFLSPFDRRREAEAARLPFTGEMSDQIALLRAYDGWQAERDARGAGGARRFADAHFLSGNGMEELAATRGKLGATLAELGFARSSAEAAAAGAGGGDGGGGADAALHKTNLVRALLCAGLYPNVAKVRMPEARYEKTAQGAIEAANEDARAVKFYLLGIGGGGGHGRVFLHPSCSLFGASQFDHRWVCYASKQQVNGDKLYVKECTAVSPLALLLFGGEVAVHHDRGTVTVDGQITFDAPGRVAVLVRELRAELDKLLMRKIAEPAFEIQHHPILRQIVSLLTTERAGA